MAGYCRSFSGICWLRRAGYRAIPQLSCVALHDLGANLRWHPLRLVSSRSDWRGEWGSPIVPQMTPVSRILAPIFAAALLVAGNSSMAGPKRQGVLELFTSQGCSSCPPADALLGRLADRKDVLALSLPVTYWDMLGWKDTLASEANTRRQKAYAEAMGRGGIYTPQMIVDGVSDVVGSREPA